MSKLSTVGAAVDDLIDVGQILAMILAPTRFASSKIASILFTSAVS